MSPAKPPPPEPGAVSPLFEQEREALRDAGSRIGPMADLACGRGEDAGVPPAARGGRHGGARIRGGGGDGEGTLHFGSAEQREQHAAASAAVELDSGPALEGMKAPSSLQEEGSHMPDGPSAAAAATQGAA